MVYTSTVFFYQNMAKLECFQKFLDHPSALVRAPLSKLVTQMLSSTDYCSISIPIFYWHIEFIILSNWSDRFNTFFQSMVIFVPFFLFSTNRNFFCIVNFPGMNDQAQYSFCNPINTHHWSNVIVQDHCCSVPLNHIRTALLHVFSHLGQFELSCLYCKRHCN